MEKTFMSQIFCPPAKQPASPELSTALNQKYRTTLIACYLLMAFLPLANASTILYRETFGRPPGNVGGDLASTVFGWQAFRSNGLVNPSISASGISGTSAGRPANVANVNAGVNSDGTIQAYENGYHFHTTGASTPILTFTPEFIINPSDYAPGTLLFSWWQGNGNANDTLRLAVRVGSQWYVHATAFSNFSASQDSFAFQAERKRVVFRPSASNWRLLNFNGSYNGDHPGVSTNASAPLVVGAAPATSLSGAITAFGLYLEGGAGTRRWDTFHIEHDVNYMNPPTLVSATAPRPDIIVLEFDRPVAASATNVFNYGFNIPGLYATNITRAGDGHLLNLQVAGGQLPPAFQVTVFSIEGENGVLMQADQVRPVNLLPWQLTRVGNFPQPVGVVSANGVNLSLAAGGNEVWGAADTCTLLHLPLSGYADIRGHFSPIEGGAPYVTAGFTLRASTNAEVKHVSLATQPNRPGGGRLELLHRWQNSGATGYWPDWQENLYAQRAPSSNGVWLRLQRLGNTASAFRSEDGVAWEFISSIPLDFEPTLVGAFGHCNSTIESVYSSLTISQVSLSTAPIPQPHISSITHAGPNLVLAGTNGTFNGGYYILSTTNLNLPLSAWERITTNVFIGGAFNFTNPITPQTSQRFFRLQLH